ncbi:DNA-binding response regulator [Fulvimarina endophytica]|uniref:DNA-binding response regulator n=1 Tax=Fulvimarina endophytica TaxID=2293836 RepID=A0A371WZ55_9HYPH|nr:response regulator transcription factor [Fulvimarina endophytica]RFC62252.1 DNA-binding response regulator [Fulvimarina endophytica]
MSTAFQVSLAVVDDHPIVRQGLITVLGRDPRFQIVAEGSSTSEALEIAIRHKPKVMLLDLGMPGGGGIEALALIRAHVPTTKCAILTVCDDAETAIKALNTGACGYILKGVSASDLKSAVWTIVNDQSFISPEFATKLLHAAQGGERRGQSEGLSHREEQILAEVEAGLTNRQIADKLGLSEKTVKYYMTTIMHKYGVTNRVSAVVAAQKLRSSQTRSNV